MILAVNPDSKSNTFVLSESQFNEIKELIEEENDREIILDEDEYNELVEECARQVINELGVRSTLGGVGRVATNLPGTVWNTLKGMWRGDDKMIYKGFKEVPKQYKEGHKDWMSYREKTSLAAKYYLQARKYERIGLYQKADDARKKYQDMVNTNKLDRDDIINKVISRNGGRPSDYNDIFGGNRKARAARYYMQNVRSEDPVQRKMARNFLGYDNKKKEGEDYYNNYLDTRYQGQKDAYENQPKYNQVNGPEYWYNDFGDENNIHAGGVNRPVSNSKGNAANFKKKQQANNNSGGAQNGQPTTKPNTGTQGGNGTQNPNPSNTGNNGGASQGNSGNNGNGSSGFRTNP